MFEPNFTTLFVSDIQKSAAFYNELLDVKPVGEESTYVMYAWPSGFRFGLWSKADVKPAATSDVMGGEISVTLPDFGAVDTQAAALKDKGHTFLQDVTDMEFGRTFVVADPDGNRVRWYAPRAGM